jgi:hypothetical protein
MWYSIYIRFGFQKGCTQLAAANDKVYQLLSHGRRFSPGTPASSTTKTGHHDIAEILLKSKSMIQTAQSFGEQWFLSLHHSD